MNHLSNRELLEQIQNLVREETKLTNLIILYVQEIEKRRLYLEVGCSTTFEFLTQKLGYCPLTGRAELSPPEETYFFPARKDSAGSSMATRLAGR